MRILKGMVSSSRNDVVDALITLFSDVQPAPIARLVYKETYNYAAFSLRYCLQR